MGGRETREVGWLVWYKCQTMMSRGFGGDAKGGSGRVFRAIGLLVTQQCLVMYLGVSMWSWLFDAVCDFFV